MERKRVTRFWWCVAAAALGVVAVAGGFFEEQVLARQDRRVLFGAKPYLVYVISNMPEEAVMAPVCGDALRVRHKGAPHCVYVPLADLGSFGKRKKELLPYNPERDSETVAVIDRATLTEAEQTAWRALRAKVFPRAAEADGAQVVIWAQNGGKSGGEYQLFLDLPQARWLAPAMGEVRALPAGVLADKSRASTALVRQVTRTAILSNDAQVADMLVASLAFDEVRAFTPREIDAYLASEASRRILALNWNAGEEFTPAMAVRVLPPPLCARAQEQTPDANGLTGWQRFCRQALAQCITGEGGETWVIAAPTAAYLRHMADTVLREGFRGGPYQLALTDLTGIAALAVGLRVDARDFAGDRQEVQLRLERAAERALQCRVLAWDSLSSADQRVLDEALRRDEIAAPPLPAGVGALLVVSLESFVPRVTYQTSHHRETPAYPVFALREPPRPPPPDPDEREALVRMLYTYPGVTTKERQASAAFQKEYAAWQDREAKWAQEHKAWQERKAAWEQEHPPVQTGLGVVVRKFPEKEPVRPQPPDPDAGRAITYYAFIYPGGNSAERRRSVDYQRAYDVWRMKSLSVYQESYRRWETARLHWEEERAAYPVDYRYLVTGTSTVKARGRLLLASDAAPRWQTPIEGNSEHAENAPENFPVRVYGEDAAPQPPAALAAFRELSDWGQARGSREEDLLVRLSRLAAYDAVERGLARLADAALWPDDLKPWNRPARGER